MFTFYTTERLNVKEARLHHLTRQRDDTLLLYRILLKMADVNKGKQLKSAYPPNPINCR